MPLVAGTRLGPYEIIAPIGKGGMGEVYRARDTKLDRDVAVKVLPDELAADEERIARFEREAKLLASLNHPNIASIYGFESGALVLELVEGPTPAERIEQGPIPVEEAIAIARQIAEALESGHEAGVIHRDLKPANIKLKEDGTVKVLDYGLAKAFEGETARSRDSELSQSPTLTRQGTQVGVILGTAAYMSPEQAKGKRVDKRADIWAFGVVLYEMLAREAPFRGESVSEVLASVIKSDPDWSELPDELDSRLVRLVRRCLAKIPTARLRDIGDARLELTEPYGDGRGESVDIPVTPRAGSAGYWLLGGVLFVAGLLGGMRIETEDADPRVVRTSVSFSGDQFLDMRGTFTPFAWSPGGNRVVYLAHNDDESEPALYVRDLDSFESKRLEGTEGAGTPFFSPDGEWVGFTELFTLKKVRIDGGAPRTLAQVAGKRNAVWTRDGDIYVPADNGLWRVGADGGDAVRVNENAWTHVSEGPFGDTLILASIFFGRGIVAFSTETGDVKTLYEGRAAAASMLASGHVLFSDGDEIRSFLVDPETLEPRTEPVTVLDSMYVGVGGFGHFAVSDSGALAYTTGENLYQLVSVGPSGDVRSLDGFEEERGIYWYPALSADGGRAVLTRVGDDGTDIWVYDLASGTRTRVTTNGNSYKAIWGPDAGSLTVRSGVDLMFSVSSDGTSAQTLFTQPDVSPDAWSTSAGVLASTVVTPSGQDILLWTPSSDAPEFPNTPANEGGPNISPDGRYLAYVSDETGNPEIYVFSYPDFAQKWTVSNDGGREPVWSRDGKSLYYRRGNDVLRADLDMGSGVRVYSREVLFSGLFDENRMSPAYDVGVDGRLLMSRLSRDAAPDELKVVLDWVKELNELVPVEP